jgi:hypothetical protein
MFTFNSKRGSVDEGTISITFHALWPKLELHIPPGVSPPRLHDLRQHADFLIMPTRYSKPALVAPETHLESA